MPLPNFIIAGPPKTGTTSLFDWLSQHPEAHPSVTKETYYFYDSSNTQSPFPNFKKDGWDGYKNTFRGWSNEKVIFEASPGYIFSNLAVEKLTEIEDLKVIIIYRNPADRLFSEYQFNRYKTKKYIGSFAEYVGYDGEQFNSTPFQEANLSAFSKRWLDKLGNNCFRIISFEEMKNDSRKVMIKLAKFLQIDDSYYQSFSFDKKNETFGLRNRKFHLFALKLKGLLPASIQKKVTPFYYSFNKTSIPQITESEKQLKLILSEKLSEQENDFKKAFKHFFL
jgi:hypothetical protein